ncbi:MAG: FAD-binding and (Fe-S)-binding domain-containing protein [Lutibacter sp.]
MNNEINSLKIQLEGEIFTDNLHKSIYATDASVYKKIPLGVVYPKNESDIKKCILFAYKNNITLIPRTAGTSLAGQCVGDGLILDLSKYFTKILAFDEQKKQITVQPGVIRDDLNRFLKPFNLFFSPNTSTSNRCMIGGMVGNNSSGTTSIQYGVTRDKVYALKSFLSDGSLIITKSITENEFETKCNLNSLEGKIYQLLKNQLSKKSVRDEIKKQFPKPTIHRRNNGYAVDELLKFNKFGGKEATINLSNLLSGSEGTLAITTEITLNLDNLPPKHSAMVAAHFTSIDESLKAVVVAMKHNLYTCELMDKIILDCTKNNATQNKNRFFIDGDPAAILMLELKAHSNEKLTILVQNLIQDLKEKKLGYAFPVLKNSEINQALDLRKAGLGLLGNMIGDKKAVACIEDTAVLVSDLPSYIDEFTQIMNRYQQDAVYYAHAGAGELHLRPILNLKKNKDVELFRKITTETAHLVKKYGGSFSGEHGDGIVRAEFIPLMIGEKNYKLLQLIKECFDPKAIFNRGKIVNPFKMDEQLRYKPNRVEPEINTFMNFDSELGILRATEKCNGSGDCRKPYEAGGTMCPSYRATKNEKDTTRARANALREFLTNSENRNRFNHKELYQVFELCLSCKACASECPSNVDVASLKAEFLYQYQKENGFSFRNKLIAHNTQINKIASKFPLLSNILSNTLLAKKIMGIAPERNIPKLAPTTLINWYYQNQQKISSFQTNKKIYLFVDEFTNYYDVAIGKQAILLLFKLGYKVNITNHKESGRAAISKGILDHAKKVTNYNVTHFKTLINDSIPLIGIEPSAILTFRDEYIKLADDVKSAKNIAKNVYTFEEFIADEFDKGNIRTDSFTNEKLTFKIHGHCQQKAKSNIAKTQKIITIPTNYSATIIASGCCGMAGSFGYEKEHYALSMKIGEDSLFKKIRQQKNNVKIIAAGTSCRHQIYDGTKINAYHPITVLYEALI